MLRRQTTPLMNIHSHGNKEINSGMALPSEPDWIDDEPYTNLSP